MPLELVHMDVCRPIQTLFHSQNRYFILFIDDFTRMTWVYFMGQKSEVFTVFEKFKTFVEKQSSYFIKLLRSDRGKEYTSNDLINFVKMKEWKDNLQLVILHNKMGYLNRGIKLLWRCQDPCCVRRNSLKLFRLKLFIQLCI